jgi:DNA gyrase subunit A
MATAQGRIKRTVLGAFEDVRPSGLIAINLDDGDTLRWVKVTAGAGELIMVTRRGRALRFKEDDVRPMGRASAGVMAIRLKDGDAIATLDVVDPQADLLIITERGMGKRTPLAQYRTTGRFTQGILTMDASRLDEIGEIADARVVVDGGDLALITEAGIVMRTATDTISRMGRATRGVIIMRPDEGDRVASLAYWQESETIEGADIGSAPPVAAEVAEVAEADDAAPELEPDGSEPGVTEPGASGD